MRRQILGGALGEVDQPGLRSAIRGGRSACEPIWPATEEMNSSVPAPAPNNRYGVDESGTIPAYILAPS